MKHIIFLIIVGTTYLNTNAQTNENVLNFNTFNTDNTFALNSRKTQSKISAYANNNVDCSKYQKKKKLGNILKIAGGGAFVLGAVVAIAGGSEGDDEALIGGNVLMVAGVGSAVTGFIIKGGAKRKLKKNDCTMNLQLKGNSIGLAFNF